LRISQELATAVSNGYTSYTVQLIQVWFSTLRWATLRSIYCRRNLVAVCWCYCC